MRNVWCFPGERAHKDFKHFNTNNKDDSVQRIGKAHEAHILEVERLESHPLDRPIIIKKYVEKYS